MTSGREPISSVCVLHLTNAVGLGGTERNIQEICETMGYGLFTHVVCAGFKAGGRERLLKQPHQINVEKE